MFNDGLRTREDACEAGRPYVSDGDLSSGLTVAKATPERAWLGEVSAVALQQALADLNSAYRNFFLASPGQGRTRSGRKGQPLRSPRPGRSRHPGQAVPFTNNGRFQVLTDGRLSLPKIGECRSAGRALCPLILPA